MSDNASTVLRDALALPADDRARVAADLIASLDENRDDPAAVQTAWAQELERRAHRALTEPQGEAWGRGPREDRGAPESRVIRKIALGPDTATLETAAIWYDEKRNSTGLSEAYTARSDVAPPTPREAP